MPTSPKVDLLGEPLTGDGAWSRVTRDRSVAALFLVVAVMVVLLIWPFLDALLFASATVVVTWPIYERVLRRMGGHTHVAAVFTAVGIGCLILAPITVVGLWFVQESIGFVNVVGAMAESGELRTLAESWLAMIAPLRDEIHEQTGWEVDLMAFVEPMQRSLVGAGQSLAKTLPEWVGSVLVAALDAFVYLFAVVTLYAEGPRLLAAVARLSPMRKEHDQRLFEVFREFSTNLVTGAITTAVVQGSIAGIGYSIAGVPNLVLVTLLTTVFGFVPIVGTAMVWVPATIYTFSTRGFGWGLFLLVWSVALTGGVDNLIRPFLLRGRSQIHPLPIFLAVLGGISWMGLPGALVGPVCVAMLLALYQIWSEQIARVKGAS